MAYQSPDHASELSYLEKLGLKHKPTKMEHNYLRHYAHVLERRRLDVRNIIEVGVQDGNSVRMWQEYFPNAIVHGVDIDRRFKSHEDERIKIWVADSTNHEEVHRLIAAIKAPIDVIIDDGSHHPYDQIGTFKNLFPHLAHGGVYFAEDLGGTRGPLRMRAIHAFMELIEGINYWPKHVSAAKVGQLSDLETENYWINNVVGVAFYRYLAIIWKGNNPGDNPYLAGNQSDVTGDNGERPEFSLSRLRELPWPRYRHRRHFVSRREANPESLARLLIRYLSKRW